jgi:hypothetical protein
MMTPPDFWKCYKIVLFEKSILLLFNHIFSPKINIAVFMAGGLKNFMLLCSLLLYIPPPHTDAQFY